MVVLANLAAGLFAPLFTGGALALQIYAGGARFNAETVVPSIVAIGIVRELGPVLGGLMVAGRVAASIAAEIGTMKVNEARLMVTWWAAISSVPHMSRSPVIPFATSSLSALS